MTCSWQAQPLPGAHRAPCKEGPPSLVRTVCWCEGTRPSLLLRGVGASLCLEAWEDRTALGRSHSWLQGGRPSPALTGTAVFPGRLSRAGGRGGHASREGSGWPSLCSQGHLPMECKRLKEEPWRPPEKARLSLADPFDPLRPPADSSTQPCATPDLLGEFLGPDSAAAATASPAFPATHSAPPPSCSAAFLHLGEPACSGARAEGAWGLQP